MTRGHEERPPARNQGHQAHALVDSATYSRLFSLVGFEATSPNTVGCDELMHTVAGRFCQKRI